MAAIQIPDPLRIACTECHRDMRVELQQFKSYNDSVIVAAECDCGRVIAEIDGPLIVGGLGTKERPIVGLALRNNPDIGADARGRIAALRERMAILERLIAAATWTREKPRKEPG
ncbi:MAG TPA: hypothetical protein VJU58_06145 [Microbacterium sp.]|nr:hypothetical protein [Microbacterium sp.]